MNIFQHKNIIKPPLLPVFISSVIQFDKFFHPVKTVIWLRNVQNDLWNLQVKLLILYQWNSLQLLAIPHEPRIVKM